MTSIDEAVNAKTPMGSDIAAGLDTLSYNQEIVFEPYVKLILPFDGFVFWVKASALSPSAVLNAMQLGAAMLNQSQLQNNPAPFVVQGSLHYSTETQQTEVSNFSRNRVVFSSEGPVRDLNQLNANLIYVCTFDAAPDGPVGSTAIKFAFSARGQYYQQANEWHYLGFSLTSNMASQLIDNLTTFDVSQPIVSNSLPLWLAWNFYDPPWPVPVPRPLVTFYPSFLVPTNLPPPYVSVHIDHGDTESFQEMPLLARYSSQSSLSSDKVRLTLYGCNNDVAESMLYALMQYSLDVATFGIMNMPVVQDEKEGQVEFNFLAQKKRILFEVSYNQGTMRDIARQLITSCTPTVTPNPYIVESDVNILV